MKAILIAVLVALAFVAAPAASAQGELDPLRDHAGSTVASATSDPQKFVTDHASEKGAANESAWDVAYACFLIAKEHADHGTPDPKLEQCKNYEEVLGIAPEKKPAAKPVADVENLSDDPVAQVEEVAGDAVATVERIVHEPTSAVDEILGFLGRVVKFVEDLLGGIGKIVGDALGSDVALADSLQKGVIGGVRAPMVTGSDVIGDAGRAIGDAVASAASAIGSGIGAVGDGIASAASGVGHGVGAVGKSIGDAASGIGHAVGDAGNALGHLVRGIFGGDAAPRSRSAGSKDQLPVDTGGVGKDLPCVTCLVHAARNS